MSMHMHVRIDQLYNFLLMHLHHNILTESWSYCLFSLYNSAGFICIYLLTVMVCGCVLITL